jgi:hypothetical protein
MQRGTNLDDGAGLAGEVSADAPGKRVFRGVACSPEAKPAPSGTAGNTVEQCRLKPCTGKPFELTDELELESQKGNPGLYLVGNSMAGHNP